MEHMLIHVVGADVALFLWVRQYFFRQVHSGNPKMAKKAVKTANGKERGEMQSADCRVRVFISLW
jgi:hypothetical protein